MALPRTLSRPPISEALVDIQAAVVAPPDAFEDLAKQFPSDYPTIEPRQLLHAEFKVDSGKLLPPIAKNLGFQGVWLFNSDKTVAVQFRPNGFTLNNLRKYIGGDRLIVEALRLWSEYSSRLVPAMVNRIALRYINRLELPFQRGDDFSRFLTAAPEVPPGAPQNVSEFLSRVVTHDGDESTVIITQQLGPEETASVVAIDIDAFKVGNFSTNPNELGRILEQLRILKNQAFFSLLTEDAVKLYV